MKLGITFFTQQNRNCDQYEIHLYCERELLFILYILFFNFR